MCCLVCSAVLPGMSWPNKLYTLNSILEQTDICSFQTSVLTAQFNYVSSTQYVGFLGHFEHLDQNQRLWRIAPLACEMLVAVVSGPGGGFARISSLGCIFAIMPPFSSARLPRSRTSWSSRRAPSSGLGSAGCFRGSALARPSASTRPASDRALIVGVEDERAH